MENSPFMLFMPNLFTLRPIDVSKQRLNGRYAILVREELLICWRCREGVGFRAILFVKFLRHKQFSLEKQSIFSFGRLFTFSQYLKRCGKLCFTLFGFFAGYYDVYQSIPNLRLMASTKFYKSRALRAFF